MSGKEFTIYTDDILLYRQRKNKHETVRKEVAVKAADLMRYRQYQDQKEHF